MSHQDTGQWRILFDPHLKPLCCLKCAALNQTSSGFVASTRTCSGSSMLAFQGGLNIINIDRGRQARKGKTTFIGPLPKRKIPPRIASWQDNLFSFTKHSQHNMTCVACCFMQPFVDACGHDPPECYPAGTPMQMDGNCVGFHHRHNDVILSPSG